MATSRVPALRMGRIVRGQRAITADTAQRLSRYFGTRPEGWLDLQTHHDLEVIRDPLEVRISGTVRPPDGLPATSVCQDPHRRHLGDGRPSRGSRPFASSERDLGNGLDHRCFWGLIPKRGPVEGGEASVSNGASPRMMTSASRTIAICPPGAWRVALAALRSRFQARASAESRAAPVSAAASCFPLHTLSPSGTSRANGTPFLSKTKVSFR